MDWLEFFAAIAWPLVTLPIALAFKKPILDLLTQIGTLTLKLPGVEAELKRFEEAKEAAEEVLPSVIASTPLPPRTEPALEKYQRLAEISPAASVSETWRDVQLELNLLALRRGVPESRAFGSIRMLLEELVRREIVDIPTANLIREMLHLRNQVSHNKSVLISQREATDYAVTAIRVLEKLRSLFPPDSTSATK